MSSITGKGFILFLTISFVNSAILSAAHVIQENEGFNQPPKGRSVNVLSVQIPESTPPCEPKIQLQPILIPIPMRNTYAMPQPYPTNPRITVKSDEQPVNFNPFQPSTWPLPNGVQIPTFQLPASGPQFNATTWLAGFLPQLLGGLNINNFRPAPQQPDVVSENVDNGNPKPLKEAVEASSRPAVMQPNISELPKTTFLIEDDLLNDNRPDQTDALLMNLLQQLGSQRRVQERIGAVYLRDLLLNRK